MTRFESRVTNDHHTIVSTLQVIIVEDDLEISPDFYEYFTATLPLLRTDPSLWCVSAWNDNGKAGLINQTAPELLYRWEMLGNIRATS